MIFKQKLILLRKYSSRFEDIFFVCFINFLIYLLQNYFIYCSHSHYNVKPMKMGCMSMFTFFHHSA